MRTNLACQLDSSDALPLELINGKVVAMARPSIRHTMIAVSIFNIFDRYLKGRKCRAFPDGVDVYLTKRERYVPDVMVVCDPDKVKANGIHGAPDLVVEILSPATAKNDRGHKKAVYERCGVREYWIVDPVALTVEQYVLEDAPESVLESMSEGAAESTVENAPDSSIDTRPAYHTRPAYSLRDVYTLYHGEMLECLSDEERAELVTEFRCGLFDDLPIRLEEIFERVI